MALLCFRNFQKFSMILPMECTNGLMHLENLLQVFGPHYSGMISTKINTGKDTTGTQRNGYTLRGQLWPKKKNLLV